MKILVTGASGLIGSALIPFLQEKGHFIIRLSHSKKNLGARTHWWDPEKEIINISDLEGCHAVINLSGENIGMSRWNSEVKKRIYDSRIKSTKLLVDTIQKLETPPKLFINASAIGYYGANREDPLTELSSAGTGFLADVCRDWEAAAEPARKAGIRVVWMRHGVVLSPHGGALERIINIIKTGLGGPLGTGQQIMSWVAIDDVVRIYNECLQNSKFDGAINVVSPFPVTNREFTKVLGKILRRPTFIPVPAFMLRLFLGEMADDMLLGSLEVIPEKLKSIGYSFDLPDLETAIKTML